jgi:hypothetical protein
VALLNPLQFELGLESLRVPLFPSLEVVYGKVSK